jgi:Flp pilus assembly protein TadB
MGVLNKLRKVGNYMRKGWHSTNPDSYSHYRRGREHERKQEERGHQEADRVAELDRDEVQCGRACSRRTTNGVASGRHGHARMILAASTVAIVAIAAVVIVALLVVMYIVPRGGRRRR